MKIYRKFFPTVNPTEKDLIYSRRILIIENAVASIIFSIGTSNFLTGYLTQLGASITLCAYVSMIPQLGCVLQIFSPFLFERLKQRKFSIWLLCLFFRLSVSLCFLVPLFADGKNLQLTAVILLYIIGFLSAGFVTPGLTSMVIDIAPQRANGRYFAKRNIIGACVCSLAMPILGKTVDYYISVGRAMQGYLIIGAVCVILTVIDLILIAETYEAPISTTLNMSLKDLILPIKDTHYRPVLLYSVITGLTGGIVAPFLMIYQLYVLNLSHTFITSMGVIASVVGMMGTWFWGKYSERSTWARILIMTTGVSLICTLGWAFVPIGLARIFAPLLMIVTSACAGGAGIASMNLQYESSPQNMKTAYVGITSGLVGIATSISSAIGTSAQSLLEEQIHNYSIPVLFILSGMFGFVNLFVYGGRLIKSK